MQNNDDNMKEFSIALDDPIIEKIIEFLLEKDNATFKQIQEKIKGCQDLNEQFEILEHVKILKKKQDNNYNDYNRKEDILYFLDKKRLIKMLMKITKDFSSRSASENLQSNNYLVKVYDIMKISKKFMDYVTGGKMDICFSAESVKIVSTEKMYKEGYKKMKERGVIIRVITEIKDNFEFLLDMIKYGLVDEIRILKKVRIGIAVSENQSMVSLFNKEVEYDPDSLFFDRNTMYHTEKEIIELNQRIFDTMWENAIPIFKK